MTYIPEPRTVYRYWCEMNAESADGSRTVPFVGEPATTPRLAIRWLRRHALCAAQRIDPAPGDALHLGAIAAGHPLDEADPVQILRAWEVDIAAHERAMDELRAGARFELAVADPYVSLTVTPLHFKARQLREARPFARAA